MIIKVKSWKDLERLSNRLENGHLIFNNLTNICEDIYFDKQMRVFCEEEIELYNAGDNLKNKNENGWLEWFFYPEWFEIVKY